MNTPPKIMSSIWNTKLKMRETRSYAIIIKNAVLRFILFCLVSYLKNLIQRFKVAIRSNILRILIKNHIIPQKLPKFAILKK